MKRSFQKNNPLIQAALLLLFLFQIEPGYLVADNQPQSQILANDFHASFNTVGHYFTQPIRWDQTDWLRLGGIVGITALSMPFDKPLRTDFQDWRKPSNSAIFDFGRWAGQGEPTLVLGGVLYGVGLFGRQSDLRVTGRLLFEAMLTAGTTTTLLKTVFGRHRPFLDEGPQQYSPPAFKSRHRSLPSGHSTVGWLTAGVLAKRTNNTVLKVLYYTGASIISISRIYHDRHWTSDVILGGFVGYAAADFVVSQEAHREAVKSKQNYSLNVSSQPRISFTFWF